MEAQTRSYWHGLRLRCHFQTSINFPVSLESFSLKEGEGGEKGCQFNYKTSVKEPTML